MIVQLSILVYYLFMIKIIDDKESLDAILKDNYENNDMPTHRGEVVISSKLTGAKKAVITKSAALTNSDSGAVLAPRGDNASTYILPPVKGAEGFNITFISASPFEHTIECASGERSLCGAILSVGKKGEAVITTLLDRFSITLSPGFMGDSLSIVCDGTSYLISGTCSSVPKLCNSNLTIIKKT